MDKKLKTIIEEIEISFDFNKVHKVMTLLNWEWYFGTDVNGEEQYGIPSLQTLKTFAFNLIEKAFHEKKQISSGGFSAGLIIDEEDIFLSFTLEEQSTAVYTDFDFSMKAD